MNKLGMDVLFDDEDDEFDKSLEKEMEEQSKVYVDKFELEENKTEGELIKMSKEEIIHYFNIIISKLKIYIKSLEKEKEDLIMNFKATTDTLLEEIKQNEFNNGGIRPQTPMLMNKIFHDKNINSNNSNNSKIQFKRCPNCTKEFPIESFIEHSLQCLRKIYRCNKCNISIPFDQKQSHFLQFQSKKSIEKYIENNDIVNFKNAILHDFPINDVINSNTGNTLLHLLAEKNRLEMINFISNYLSTFNDKVNPNIKNKRDLTPLMISCKLGNIEITKLLIQIGGDLNIKNILGETPLTIAQTNNHEKLAWLLIKQYKANIGFKKY